MDFSEIIALYGLDIILLTIVNTALAEVLKRTLLKDRPKIVTAIIYGAGTLMYIIYASISMKNALYIFDDFVSVVEHGISIGTLTMLLCAAIDRFFDGGTPATADDAIVWLLKGWVKSGKESECAARILELCKTLTGEELKKAVEEVVKEYAADGVNDSQAELIAALACEAAEKLALNGESDDAMEEQTAEDVTANSADAAQAV